MIAFRLAMASVLAVCLMTGPADARRKKTETAAQQAAPATDTLIDNVNGYTFNEQGKLTRFSGLVIGPDGRVRALLKQGDARAHARYRFDAGGRTLLPGMIDAHTHVMSYGLQAFRVDLTDASSPEDVVARLRRFASENPRARWITGSGWREEIWGRAPVAKDIDAAGLDLPIWLTSADGNAGVVSTQAIRQMALTAQTPNPAGGLIGRLADGKPSGLLSDRAMLLVEAILPHDNPVVEEAALSRALKGYAANGVTLVHDIGTRLSDWMLYRRFGDSDNLSVRIYAIASDMGVLDQVTPLRPTPWLYDTKLTMRAVLIRADGGFSSRGAWLRTAYADQNGTGAGPALADAQIRNLISKASMVGAQSVIVAQGDAAIQQVSDALAEITPTYGKERRYRVNYATLADERLRAQLSEHRALVGLVPVEEVGQRAVLTSRLGRERAAQAHPWKAFLTAGLPVAFGSGPQPKSPFMVMQAAVSRSDDSALSLEQAFDAQTRGGAYAAFAEDKAGRLIPGYLADFIIVDRDIFTVPTAQLGGTRVDETWVGGKRIYVRAGAGVEKR